MKILISGAKGQLGTALTKECFGHGHIVIALGRDELDITHESQIDEVVQKEAPSVIVNCAAYNDVEKAADHVELAYRLNAFAPYALARAAKKYHSRLVHIGTDYVFSGRSEPYDETDIADPVNVYGASKLAGEQLARIVDPNTIIVRVSWLYGKSTSDSSHNFVQTILDRTKTQKEVRVVADQVGVPTYAPDAAYAIRALLDRQAPGGIYNVANSGSCSRYEQAKKIFAHANITTPLLPITTSESGSTVERPACSILATTKINTLGIGPLRPWDEAMGEFLQKEMSRMAVADG